MIGVRGENPYDLYAFDKPGNAARYEAHAGQTDKSGVPYIFHPYHLAEQMSDEISVCVALLHDVLEDTPVTVRELEREFPPAVTEAVRLLTYDREMDYFDYIRSLAVCPVARQVKLADLRHNQDQTRLEGCMQVSEEQREKWADQIPEDHWSFYCLWTDLRERIKNICVKTCKGEPGK